MNKWVFWAPGLGPDGRHRRSVLAGLLGCAGGVWLGSRSASRSLARAWLSGSVTGFHAWVDPQAMRAVGALYLATHPNDADPGHLHDALAGNRSAPLDEAIVERIARDWREQDIVVIAGWVFARTEARLCALMHLDGTAR